MLNLTWPIESTSSYTTNFNWSDNNANVLLDFHGNPSNSVLTVFSDGNHHMALEETLSTYSKKYLDNQNIFYVTLPPHVLAGIIDKGGIQIANIELSIKPDVIIGPEHFVKQYSTHTDFTDLQKIAQSLGNSFLRRKNYTSDLSSMSNLIHSNANLFISNPDREKASFDVYWQTLQNFAIKEKLEDQLVRDWFKPTNRNIICGEHVHHREAPEYLHQRKADITLLYHHLALRYTRIFPDLFEMSTFYGSGTEECDQHHVKTEYFATAKNTPQARELFYFLISQETSDIYSNHGLGK